MFFGAHIFLKNLLIADGFLHTGGSILPRSTRPGMVTGFYESLVGMPISKTFQDVIWEERLAIHLSFRAPSYR